MERVEFEAWRHSPVGKWFFDEVLEKQISAYARYLADGYCKAENPNVVAMHYFDQVGIIAGIESVRNLDPFGDMNEDSSNWEASPS